MKSMFPSGSTPGARAVGAIALALAALTVRAVAEPVEAASDPALDAAARFVERFQRELSFVVGDELYVQERKVGTLPPEKRTIRGEIFLTYLVAERHWITVHDFAEVDGSAVEDRRAVRDLLVSGSIDRIASSLIERNARYNLGNVRRNFNEPTLPLQLFDPPRLSRLRVSRIRTTVRDGRTFVTLRLREDERPTLVSSSRGAAVYADAEIDADAETGEIVRTLIKLRDQTLEASLETTYAFSPALKMLVPAVFVERYAETAARRAEVITCRSEYSNYRRFESSGRLLMEAQ